MGNRRFTSRPKHATHLKCTPLRLTCCPQHRAQGNSSNLLEKVAVVVLFPSLDKPEPEGFLSQMSRILLIFPFSCQFVKFVAGYSCSIYKNSVVKVLTSSINSVGKPEANCLWNEFKSLNLAPVREPNRQIPISRLLFAHPLPPTPSLPTSYALLPKE